MLHRRDKWQLWVLYIQCYLQGAGEELGSDGDGDTCAYMQTMDKGSDT